MKLRLKDIFGSNKFTSNNQIKNFELFCKIITSKLIGQCKKIMQRKIKTKFKMDSSNSYNLKIYDASNPGGHNYIDADFFISKDEEYIGIIISLPDVANFELMNGPLKNYVKWSEYNQILMCRKKFPFKKDFTKKEVEQIAEVAFRWFNSSSKGGMLDIW